VAHDDILADGLAVSVQLCAMSRQAFVSVGIFSNSHQSGVQIMMSDAEVGAPDDVGLETFKAGAVLTEEEQPHALPTEQWASLAEALKAGAPTTHVSQVMREISDAVAHELQKEVRRSTHDVLIP
jgi:hypothetical protein